MSSQSMQRLFQGLCILLFLSSAPALAQKENPITWTVASEQTAQPLKPGALLKAQLTARIEERWHLYAMEQPQEGGPRPTRVLVPAGQPFTLDGKIDAPGPIRENDPNFGFETDYYEGSVTFEVPLRIAATAEAGRQKAVVEVRFQTCNQEICLPPKTLKLELEVEIAK
jgi:DsbC/DsbD-like thiol-disulfide interchange protein